MGYRLATIIKEELLMSNEKMVEVYTPSKPYQKPVPEFLLPNGTIVTLHTDLYKGKEIKREIKDSLPSDQYPHRYHLKEYDYTCEDHDFASIQLPDGTVLRKSTSWDKLKHMTLKTFLEHISSDYMEDAPVGVNAGMTLARYLDELVDSK
jgi:hypothetical protein